MVKLCALKRIPWAKLCVLEHAHCLCEGPQSLCREVQLPTVQTCVPTKVRFTLHSNAKNNKQSSCPVKLARDCAGEGAVDETDPKNRNLNNFVITAVSWRKSCLQSFGATVTVGYSSLLGSRSCSKLLQCMFQLVD